MNHFSLPPKKSNNIYKVILHVIWTYKSNRKYIHIYKLAPGPSYQVWHSRVWVGRDLHPTPVRVPHGDLETSHVYMFVVLFKLEDVDIENNDWQVQTLRIMVFLYPKGIECVTTASA